MRAAEFRVRCERIGLLPTQIARELDVARRTADRWWATLDPNPAAVDLLVDREDHLHSLAEAAVSGAERVRAEHGHPEAVQLHTFRDDNTALREAQMPASQHRALTGLICEMLDAEGLPFTVDWA